MANALIILDQKRDISERYRVELKVLEVAIDAKNPEGIKVSFVLIDVLEKKPRLLVDNHAPFGYHVHEELPGNKDSRRKLETADYREALDEFWRLTKEITGVKN